MTIFLAALGAGLVTTAILAIGAVGFTLQFAVTNVLNLAYGSVMICSAFAAYVVVAAIGGPWWGFMTGAVTGAILTLALGHGLIRPFLRRGTSPFGMAIVTMGVELIVVFSIQGAGGPGNFVFPPPASGLVRFGAMTLSVPQIVIVAIAVLLSAAVAVILRFSRLGIAMRATAGDSELARVSGIDVVRTADVTWLVTGALCGVSGVALVVSVQSFSATSANSLFMTLIAAAVLGGVGRPYGALLGSFIIGMGSEVVAAYLAPAYNDVIAFGALVLVLLVRPTGILRGLAAAGERQ